MQNCTLDGFPFNSSTRPFFEAASTTLKVSAGELGRAFPPDDRQPVMVLIGDALAGKGRGAIARVSVNAGDEVQPVRRFEVSPVDL